MKTPIGLKSIAAVLMAAMLFSCQKQEMENSLIDTMMLDTEMEALFEDILAEVDDFSFSVTGKDTEAYANAGKSGSRTVSTTFSGDTIIHVISFKDFVHAHDPKGKIKNGNMTIKILGRPYLPNFWRQVSFENYKINDLLVEGTKEIEKTDQYTMHMLLVGGKVTWPDGKTCSREYDKMRTWISGYDTPLFIWDDAFSVTGESWGTNYNNKSFYHEITVPLIHERGCKWIVEGVVSSVVDGIEAVLDYGDGTCDNLATLTSEGETKTIELKPKP